MLSARRRTYEDHLSGFPALRERLAGAAPETSVRGAGPMRQRVRGRVAGRVLLVGDAAGYVDAITGEGIALAIGEAHALVRAVAADRPAQYERQWRKVSRSYRVVTEALLLARGPMHLGRAIVPGRRPPAARVRRGRQRAGRSRELRNRWSSVSAMGTPDRIRTCAHGSGGRCSIP